MFDLGGVLIELTGVPAFSSWLGDRMAPDEIWRCWLASPAVRDFEAGRIDPEAFADRLIVEFALPVDRQQFLEDFTAWPRGLYPGAADLVDRAGRRCVCATLSNTNALHWPRFLKELGPPRIERELFEFHFASHLIGKLKPDHEVFEHAITALGCSPSEILFIDDQPLNVESARRAGIEAALAAGVVEAERVLTRFGVLRPPPRAGSLQARDDSKRG